MPALAREQSWGLRKALPESFSPVGLRALRLFVSSFHLLPPVSSAASPEREA